MCVCVFFTLNRSFYPSRCTVIWSLQNAIDNAAHSSQLTTLTTQHTGAAGNSLKCRIDISHYVRRDNIPTTARDEKPSQFFFFFF